MAKRSPVHVHVYGIILTLVSLPFGNVATDVLPVAEKIKNKNITQ